MNVPGRTAFHVVRYLIGVDIAETQTTPAEHHALEKYATGKRRVVEIGVYEGATTRLLARSMHTDGELFAIDPFIVGRWGISWARLIARLEVCASGRGSRVRFIRSFSSEAIRIVDGDFDFVFVDGDHSLAGVEHDWNDWSPRVSAGGIIALHDSLPPAHNPAVAKLGSCQYFESHIRHDSRFEIIEQVDSLAVLQRRHA